MEERSVYSDAEAHLANLDHCGNRALRRAYLAILLGATGVGYDVSSRTTDGKPELRIRDYADRQLFAIDIDGGALRFCIRRPALTRQPGLAADAMVRFGDRVEAAGDDITIQIRDAGDGDRIAEWLFGVHSAAMRTVLTPEYAERISA
jgi:hypothetical protein